MRVHGLLLVTRLGGTVRESALFSFWRAVESEIRTGRGGGKQRFAQVFPDQFEQVSIF